MPGTLGLGWFDRMSPGVSSIFWLRNIFEIYFLFSQFLFDFYFLLCYPDFLFGFYHAIFVVGFTRRFLSACFLWPSFAPRRWLHNRQIVLVLSNESSLVWLNGIM